MVGSSVVVLMGFSSSLEEGSSPSPPDGSGLILESTGGSGSEEGGSVSTGGSEGWSGVGSGVMSTGGSGSEARGGSELSSPTPTSGAVSSSPSTAFTVKGKLNMTRQKAVIKANSKNLFRFIKGPHSYLFEIQRLLLYILTQIFQKSNRALAVLLGIFRRVREKSESYRKKSEKTICFFPLPF